MKLKIRKMIFYLHENSRRKIKELAKKTRSSQQSCSYLVKQYRKRNYIQDFTTLVDPIKLGFINIMVGFDFLRLEYQKRRELVQELSSLVNVVMIEENREGVDLLVEYSVQNMSAFNKLHKSIIEKFQESIVVKFIYPVIVKHKFQKNFLVRKGDLSDIILCGDRESLDVTPREKEVLLKLVEVPDITITKISFDTGLSGKTVMKIKKSLENKGIVKGYTCTVNHAKLGIHRYHVLFKFANEGAGVIDSFVQYGRLNKNITSIIKLLGHYQVLITVEELKISDIIKQIRAEFPMDDYLVIRSDRIIKKKDSQLKDV